MKQKFIEWFTKNNNGCSPAMEDDRSFVHEKTQHMFEAYLAGVAEGEAKCAALAAELSAVEEIHNEAVFITDDHYEQCPPEVQKIIRSLAVMQIPAYQAFLAEVRAAAVDEVCLKISNAIVNCYQDEQVGLDAAATICGDFAAQLRKGVQS
ncbi:hypothetical protein [Enterobacter cloacae]|uniref:hypothetical protein n=1 Tax=Enterobacter cloacae TaxID=550 RepID=UPI002074E988|nr:hypothetical protein [Enterobacter cloacae]MCM7495351.1 hypothetical protein [Enterobacter cloacae]